MNTLWTRCHISYYLISYVINSHDYLRQKTTQPISNLSDTKWRPRKLIFPTPDLEQKTFGNLKKHLGISQPLVGSICHFELKLPSLAENKIIILDMILEKEKDQIGNNSKAIYPAESDESNWDVN